MESDSGIFCITEFLVLNETISVLLRQTEDFVRNKDVADKCQMIPYF